MKELVIKPKWSNFSSRNSKMVSDFFRMEKINDDQESFSLDLLRNYYRRDRIAGTVLMEELSLRGYSFIANNNTDFLPTNYEPNKIIKVSNEHVNCFQKINYSIIGLNGFVKKFNIKDDMFFDYIPIEGFLKVNKNISLDIIENEFINAGFIVENINSKSQMNIFDIMDISNLQRIKEYMEKEKILSISDFCEKNEKLISSIPNLNKYDIKKIKLITDWFDNNHDIKDFRFVTINNYFDFKDKKFEYYCNMQGYKTVIDLLNDQNYRRFKKKVVTYIEMFIVYLKVFYYENLEPEKANIKIRDIENIGTENTIKLLHDNNIFIVRDLLRINLYDISGLGKKKINNITSILFNIFNDSKKEYTPKELIKKSLYNIKIEDLFCEGPQVFFDYCVSNNIVYVRDLAKLDLNKELDEVSGLGAKRKNEILNKLGDNKYNVSSPEELLNVLFDDFITNNDDLYQIVYDRIVNNKTLGDLGTEKQVTRERIRQIEAKGMRIIRALANTLYEIIIKDKKYICIGAETLNDIFNDVAKSKIMFSVLKNREEFYYRDDFEKLFIVSSCPECYQMFMEIDYFLSGISDESKDILTIQEVNEYIDNIIIKYHLESYISSHDFSKIINNSNYRFVGNTLVKKEIYNHDIYSNILKDYYPDGMTFNEENCNNMKKIYYELTNEKSDLSVRNLTAKLQRKPEIILRGPNSYIHIDNVKIDKNLLEVIKKYIIHLFEHEDLPSVYSDRIYNVFKNELSRYGIDNYAYIYGILRYYYPNEFDYNNFWITKNGKKEVTRDLALIDYLKKDTNYNVGVPKEKIISLFGLSGPYLLNLTSNSKEIQECHCKENLIYFENYKLSDKTLERIENYINENIDLQYGYISLRYLLSKYSIYFEEENIIDENTLSNVLKKYLKKYFIKGQYICKKATDETLDEYFFFDIYLKNNKIITRKGFEAFAEEKGIYSNRVYDVLKNRFGELYQINITDFVSNLNISKQNISDIYKIIDRNIEEKDYLPLSDLKKNGDLFKMPNINCPWNEYLLRTILIKNPNEMYNMVDIPSAMLFNEKGILIRKELNINNYIDFLVYVYKEKNYYTLESVNRVYKELQSNGLVSDTLPYEFKKKIVDEYGRLMRC